MSKTTASLLKAALAAIHYTGTGHLLAPLTRGRGAVLMLHHVRPQSQRGFQPNRILEVTPAFLETSIREVRRAGFDIVSLDEAHARMTGVEKSQRPFVCFTFDDGYRDNRDHALPIMRRHGAPFTIYVATDFADGRGFLWWLVLEEVIERRRRIEVRMGAVELTLRCASDAEKAAAFEQIYWRLRALPEADARAIVARLADESGIDVLGPCAELVMGWRELGEIARDPLVTIGAHTRGHFALAGPDAATAQAEIAGSVERIEHELGLPCHHFSYPYGDEGSAGEREFETAARLGLATAVTTRKGVLRDHHAGRMTALPRLSLNGEYQRAAYLRALLSGVPFALLDGVRGRRAPALPCVSGYLPSGPSAGASGRCIQRTSSAAGTTQARPPTK
jgi:peptidoglycan/xylan/chitin deacetylase (PgdA/CDA1 family)